MIISQLPSLEEIYDFSSQDLQKMATEFSARIDTASLTNQQQQSYRNFIESIHIELQQRKTLQFFEQLCQIQNPYLKKVTDFNNEFLKLASQALASQEKNVQKQSNKQKQQTKLVQIQEQNGYGQKTEEDEDHSSITSMNRINKRLNTNNSKFKYTNPDKAYSVASQTNTTSSHQIKMGLAGNKTKTKMKNNMKDFILSTLSKNKNQGCYVVKKSGPSNKPVPTFTVNQRGHLVNPNSLQPIGTLKSIKSSSKARQSVPSQTNSKTTSTKVIASDKNIQLQRQQAFKKVNHIKPQKKKQKALNNKDLVEMIREQQKSKENKAIKQKNMEKNAQKNNNNVQVSSQKQLKNASSHIKLDQNNLIEQEQRIRSNQNENTATILNKIEVSNTQSVQVERKKQEIVFTIEKKRQQVIQKNQKKIQILKQQSVIEQIMSQQILENIQVYHHPDMQSYQKDIGEQIKQNILQEIKTQQHQIIRAKNQNLIKQSKIRNNLQSYDRQMQQLVKIQQEIALQSKSNNQKDQQQEQAAVQNQRDSQNSGLKMVNSTQNHHQRSKQIQNKQESNKKCYNQDYWINIREQAEQQIKRFKQTKQIEQLSKKSMKVQIGKSMQKIDQKQRKIQVEQIQEEKQLNNQFLSQIKQEVQDESDLLIEKKKKQLAKMINDHNKRKTVTKTVTSIISPPKPLYAIPTFNYLQIYPTFNHIFSVMYTKSEHQALMDVPIIMRDMINMFTTHINHFKDKASYFKPAIFLPFDTANSLQMTDPRQLLLHAQNTHVDLKKIVQRLQTFNENLHGQFNSTDTRYYRVIKTKEEVYDIISTGFLRRKGWKELPHGCSLRSSWNLFWSWAKPDIDISKLLVWQRINHFPFNKNLSRKDLLYKNLDSFRKMLKIPFEFLPLTYNLPKQFTQFSIKFHEQQFINRDKNYWIMKPIGKSRGRGIKVINNLAELNYTDNIVVQKYIANPLLLDGYKFDMRIYVLVTNFHPLQAFVYKEGFARLSTQKYNLDPAFMKNAFIHLTNFAVNKNNEEAKQSAAFSGGSKISLKVLKQKLGKMNYTFSKIWSQVHQIIIKSLLGCSISVPSFPGAFQLFGYDIMIDTQGSCHLIQINASPSLQRSYLIDQIIKQSLIDDILDIVNPPDFDKQQLLDIMSERLSNKKKITPQQDLISIARVLKYQKLRKIGQMPQNMGLFEMIAPSKMSSDLQKQIKGRSGANNPKNID